MFLFLTLTYSLTLSLSQVPGTSRRAESPLDSPLRMVFDHGSGEGGRRAVGTPVAEGGGRAVHWGKQAGGAGAASAAVRTRLRPSSAKI